MEDNKSELLTLCTLKVHSCWYKQETKNGQQKHLNLNKPKELGFCWTAKQSTLWHTNILFSHVQSRTSSSDKTKTWLQFTAVETTHRSRSSWMPSHGSKAGGLQSPAVWAAVSARGSTPIWFSRPPALSWLFATERCDRRSTTFDPVQPTSPLCKAGHCRKLSRNCTPFSVREQVHF